MMRTRNVSTFFKKAICSVFLFNSLYGFENPISCPMVDVSINVREDALNWSIAGVDDHPNVASVMEWNGVKSFGGGGSLKALFFSRCPVEIKGSYNKIFSGENHDRDFFGEDKTGLFLKSRSNASRGELFETSAEIGLNMFQEPISFGPHLGYSHKEQHLKAFDGFTEFNLFEPEDVGPIKGLNSSYNARWSGPYLGVKGFVPLFGGKLGFGFDYYYPRYTAKGHANLRPDILGPYVHRASGWGKEFVAEFQSLIQEKLYVDIKLKFDKFWTKKGKESEILQSDMGSVPIKVEVNRIQLRSRSISAHVIKTF